MWIEIRDKTELEEMMFHFLVSLRDGERPAMDGPIVVDGEIIRELYRHRHPDLLDALHHCIAAYMIEINPEPKKWPVIQVSAEALGLAIVLWNCLCGDVVRPEDSEIENYPVAAFTTWLMARIPPARTPAQLLSYHAVLRGTRRFRPRVNLLQDEWYRSTLELSPLTQLEFLDLYKPAVLEEKERELLPRRLVKKGRLGFRPWKGLEDWTESWEKLLILEYMARWLRHVLLALPENAVVNSSVGIILKELLRTGKRDFVLAYYEAFELLNRKSRKQRLGGIHYFWPQLEEARKMLSLSIPGDDNIAAMVNNRGNAYLLKFLPLVEIVIEENGVPTDFRHLSRRFVREIHGLLKYTSYGGRRHLAFNSTSFRSEEGERKQV